ncbi:MAG: alginate export family protein [Pseudomonadota bacterium]
MGFKDQIIHGDALGAASKSAMALAFGVIASTVAVSGAASAGDKWKVTVDNRYRAENVKQDGFDLDAQAHTYRSRYGLYTPWFNFVRFGAEFEAVTEIGDPRFNNTFNGLGNRPVVADVESAELNQAFAEIKPAPGTLIKGGRFVEALDNQRFFGHVGWRQNNQTFDGAKVTNTSLLPDTELYYAYIGNVNRIFSDRSTRTAGPLQGDLNTNIHLTKLTYSGLPFGKLKFYNFYSEVFSNADVLSNNSFGFSFAGAQPLGNGLKFKYYAEYARQSDVGDSPVDYQADYVHLAPALSYAGFTVTGGYELLGSDDGVRGFQTPFATLHKFNGFADQFLATPAVGLQDLYVDVTYKFSGVTGPIAGFINGSLLKFQYHDFDSDEGDLDIGEEIGLYAKMPLKPILKGLYAEAKYAHFFDDESNAVKTADVEKFIFGLGYKTSFDPEAVLRTLR